MRRADPEDERMAAWGIGPAKPFRAASDTMSAFGDCPEHDGRGPGQDIWHDGITAAELDAMHFPPIRWIVPGIIAEGCTLLAGRPKLGKSWLVLDAGLAVAAGGETLGQRVEAGDVLYLALEDNRRRLQSRVRRIWPAGTAMPKRLRLMTEWPTAGAGAAAIRRWIKATPGARLVIVDVLAMFKGATPAKGRETLYEADYMALKGLQSLAMETGVAIVVVHHTRKSGAEDDPFEKVSGTLGLSGAADTTIILDRDGQGCTLYGRGRDVEEFETAVQFDRLSCRWRALGDAGEVRRSDERTTILTVLTDATEPMNPREIAAEADMSRNNVDRLLGKMAKAGEVVKIGRGCYVHPDRADLLSHTPGKNGKKVRSKDSEATLPAAAPAVSYLRTDPTRGIDKAADKPHDACAHCGKPGADADATDGARSARVHRGCFAAWFEAALFGVDDEDCTAAPAPDHPAGIVAGDARRGEGLAPR
jgi:hypothetical protein